MKKKISILFLTGLLLVSSVFFTACGKEKPYIGTFTSIWVEGRNTNTTFTLTIDKDRTFTLERFDGIARTWTRSGEWAGNKSADSFGLICICTRDSGINYYFTLMETDSKCIIASPGIAGAFDLYTGYIVIFKKN